jgi:aminopeptidase-like protein
MDAEGAGPAAGPEGVGAAMMELIAQLYPICRSITGDGIRQTLRAIGERIPLVICEVPIGTQVFDWTVPREWSIRDAFVKDARGERVIDFRCSNLHVVNYSIPIHRTMPLAELNPHLHTLPEHPDWIPYRTSYYHETWGFCLSQRQLEALRLRRAAVLLAGLRPAGGMPDAHPARTVPAVPHLGRQPGVRDGASAGRHTYDLPGCV